MIPKKNMASNDPIKTAVIFGTRPEAIKLAPLIRRMVDKPDLFQPITIVTAQHREMLDQVLELFSIKPDHDLCILRPRQTLAEITASAIAGLDSILSTEKPDFVVVQGDTTTTFVGALSAFYHMLDPFWGRSCRLFHGRFLRHLRFNFFGHWLFFFVHLRRFWFFFLDHGLLLENMHRRNGQISLYSRLFLLYNWFHLFLFLGLRSRQQYDSRRLERLRFDLDLFYLLLFCRFFFPLAHRCLWPEDLEQGFAGIGLFR